MRVHPQPMASLHLHDVGDERLRENYIQYGCARLLTAVSVGSSSVNEVAERCVRFVLRMCCTGSRRRFIVVLPCVSCLAVVCASGNRGGPVVMRNAVTSPPISAENAEAALLLA